MKSMLDLIINEIDKGLKYSTQNYQTEKRKYPAQDVHSEDLDEIEKYHSAGLMRVNHSGEVCAQALYRGQALTAKLKGTRYTMEKAAEEELDHLAWCNKRLEELGQGPSKLSPLWYSMSFTLGAIAGAIGDKWSLGFVEETEDQVVKHLEGHIKNISSKDKKTIAIMDQMKKDEEVHGQMANKAGAAELPGEVKELMAAVAKVMTKTSYEI